ncbi:NmrA family transcriptional regulator [Metarhizium album ARSEF 1941]|uniref:NmrA family transcriptional regulator n=1 Tax=Metarhizium album (strain ARSEF 1941) TaxID=1081103 RepID=A0A0B2WT48_METAS|nr:NmrA family transcriptional regulator [Metarhizium album ARSEF 1941]KHN96774.1 NmrA family transcriptional regulator [Metarhizium album ARSEF 1941]
MSKVLVVFGATGNQGGSVVDSVLGDAALSQEYKIRAVTRDTSTPAALHLQQKKVEVVTGNADDTPSVEKAVQGAHTVFFLTTTTYDDKLEEREVSQGKRIADAAVAAGAKYLIFSTLPSISENSGGRYNKGGHFDCKTQVEKYIRTLPVKSAFFAPGCFMQNLATNMRPNATDDGTYVLANVASPTTKLPLIDITDTGKYVSAILADPDAFEGKVLCAATRLYSIEEMVGIISKVTGKTVRHRQLPEDVFRQHMPPTMADYIVHMLLYIQDFGYYGKDTEELVAWTARQARGKLHSLEDYLAENPLELN